jgi:hypothetical protein
MKFLHTDGVVVIPISAVDSVTAIPALLRNCVPVPMNIPVGPYTFLDVSQALTIGFPAMSG